ncbi:MAG: CPBP family glutamic-type intramembrane protease [Actinomycetota bacterium]
MVLAVGIFPLTINAIRSLAQSWATREAGSAVQIAVPGQPRIDITLAVVALAIATAPVLLVAYLLARSGESLRELGLDLGRLRKGVGLAVLLVVGMLIDAGIIEAVAHALHWSSFNTAAEDGMTGWYLIVFLAAAAWTALVEEVLVCGYLLHRLRQLGWSDRKSLAASTTLRASYHAYGGLPLVSWC